MSILLYIIGGIIAIVVLSTLYTALSESRNTKRLRGANNSVNVVVFQLGDKFIKRLTNEQPNYFTSRIAPAFLDDGFLNLVSQYENNDWLAAFIALGLYNREQKLLGVKDDLPFPESKETEYKMICAIMEGLTIMFARKQTIMTRLANGTDSFSDLAKDIQENELAIAQEVRSQARDAKEETAAEVGADASPESNVTADNVDIVQAFGKAIDSDDIGNGLIIDESKLPFTKEQIKAAIFQVLKTDIDPQMREAICGCYPELASWQKGVGEKSIHPYGLDLTKAGSQQTDEIVEAMTSTDPKWRELKNAETELLYAELAEFENSLK